MADFRKTIVNLNTEERTGYQYRWYQRTFINNEIQRIFYQNFVEIESTVSKLWNYKLTNKRFPTLTVLYTRLR